MTLTKGPILSDQSHLHWTELVTHNILLLELNHSMRVVAGVNSDGGEERSGVKLGYGLWCGDVSTEGLH